MMSLSVASAEPPDAEAPSVDLLLYLGEFEDTNGDFVDPIALSEAAPPQSGDEDDPVADRNSEKRDELQ
jgi:hypothetical protein